MTSCRRMTVPVALATVLVVAGCGTDEEDGDGARSATPAATTATDLMGGEASDDDADGLFPDVIGATAERSGDGNWTFAATLSSPYDTPERYADAWRVVGPDGTVYGIRELAHDHQNEQPFTRSLPGVEIPASVEAVRIEGRDQRNGWGGATVEIVLDRD